MKNGEDGGLQERERPKSECRGVREVDEWVKTKSELRRTSRTVCPGWPFSFFCFFFGTPVPNASEAAWVTENAMR